AATPASSTVSTYVDSMTGAVYSMGEQLVDALSTALGIRSPSREFRYLGEMSAAGFMDGWMQRIERMQTRMMDSFDFGAIQGNLTRILDRQMNMEQQARRLAPLVQSYATHTNVSNSFGPFTVNTPMDWAELEFRMRRILVDSF